ncbi:MAG: sigma 54 modulation/S30EA ribosomal C-terminal domain-containing protein [Acidimicrobiia bacterium]
MNAQAPIEVTMVLGDGVTEEERDRAVLTVRDLASKASRPVIFARVKLLKDDRRPSDEQAIAQGTLDMSGAVIRAQVAASSIPEAVDLLAMRIQRRMRRITEQREDANQRPAATPDGQWRSGDMPTSRPGYYTRPVDERRIVRRKTYAPAASSIADALFDLDVLDHRFFLFTDGADGVDAVVFESDDGVKVRRLDGSVPPDAERFDALGVDNTPAAELSDTEAQERLDVSDSPFIFFRQAGSGRGAVLYRRYDGHYGLVEPAV